MPSSRDPQDYFGAGSFEEDDFGDPRGAPIETADEPSRRDVSPVSALSPLNPAPRVRPRAWPTGTSPDSAGISIEAVAIRATGGFGDAPANPLFAPLYALGVARRRKALRRMVADLGKGLSGAEYDRDCLVVAMVRDLRGKLLLTEPGERLFEPVVALERTALERRAALAGKSAEYDRRSSELEELRAGIEHDVAARRAIVEQRRGECDEQRRSLDRAEAKKKRLYIEVRTILEAVERNGGVSSPALTERLSALEAAIAEQKPSLEALTRNVQTALSSVTSATREAEQLASKLAHAERLRSELDNEFQKEIGARNQDVSVAEKERFDALSAVGVAVLAARGRVIDVSPETLAFILKSDAVVLERATALEKTVRALDLYDRDAYRRGIVVAVSAAAIALVLLGVLVAR